MISIFSFLHRALTEYNSYHEDNNNNIIDINSIQKSCEAKRKIVFHKTHKCSSTTIQNILFRYTKKHSLHLALPDRGNFLGEDSGFSVNFHKKHSIFQHYFKVCTPEKIPIRELDALFFIVNPLIQ